MSKHSIFGRATNRSQPNSAYIALTEEEARRLLRFYAGFAGGIAAAISVVVPAASHLGEGGCWRDSLSHYYYSPVGGNLFVILLALVAGALFFYRGETKVEGKLSSIAAFGMVIVAFVPTSGLGCEPPPPGIVSRVVVDLAFQNGAWEVARDPARALTLDREWTAYVHYAGAAVLLVVLMLFCFLIFTRVIEGEDTMLLPGTPETRVLKDGKRSRNRIYRFCGTLIAGCLAGLVAYFLASRAGRTDIIDAWTRLNMTFWLEALALVSFGVAFLVKGRVLMGSWLERD